MKIAFILACFFFGAAARAVDSAPVVLVAPAEKVEIFDLLSYPARLTPSVNAIVLAETDGILQAPVTPLGQRVKRGQVLARIKNTDPIYDYRPAAVTAPVDGVVSRVELTAGSQVRKGDTILQVTDPSKVRIQVEIAATDLGLVTQNMTGDLWISGEFEPIEVKILGVSPLVDPATGTASAELAATSKNQLFPGTVGRVTFKVHEHLGFQIPQDAVVFKENKTFLRTVDKDTAKLVPVNLGPTRRGIVEVMSGLKEGDQVIVRANQYIGDGEKVTVDKPKGPPPGKGPQKPEEASPEKASPETRS